MGEDVFRTFGMNSVLQLSAARLKDTESTGEPAGVIRLSDGGPRLGEYERPEARPEAR